MSRLICVTNCINRFCDGNLLIKTWIALGNEYTWSRALGRFSANYYSEISFYDFLFAFFLPLLKRISLLFVRLSLLTMTNPNQLCDVLLFVCSKMADETNLSSKLPVADRTREI